MSTVLTLRIKDGRCSHCNRPMKRAWIVDGKEYAQECFKKLFTEKTDIDKIGQFTGRTLWIKLDDDQVLRLVVAKIKKGWLSLIGEEREHQAVVQKVLPTEAEARKKIVRQLTLYMKTYGFKEITTMTTDYKQLME